MKIRELMTAEVATAAPDTTLEDIATMMRDLDTGVIPIVDGGELKGLVTDRDIVIRCIAGGKDPSDTTVEEILSEDLETVDPDSDVEEASQLMAEKQIRRLPVVEDGRLVGMISLGDIAVKGEERHARHALENVSERGEGEQGAARRAARTTGSATGAAVRTTGRAYGAARGHRLDQRDPAPWRQGYRPMGRIGTAAGNL